jgi:colicin import membrane protein
VAQFEQELALEHAKTSEAQAAKDELGEQKAALEKQVLQLQQDLAAARKDAEKPQMPPAPPPTVEADAKTGQSELEQQLKRERDARLLAEKILADNKKTDDDALKKEKAAREKAEKDAKDQADAAQRARTEAASAEKTATDLRDQIRKLNAEIDKLRASHKRKP